VSGIHFLCPVSQTTLIKCSRLKDEVVWVSVCVLSLILSAEEGWLHDTQTVTAVCVCVCVCVAYFMSLVKSRVFKRGQVEKSHGLRSVKSNASSQAYGWYFFMYTLSSHWFSWIYVKLHCNTSKTLAVLFVCCCWFGEYHHHPVLWWFKCLKNILAGHKLWMKVLLLFSI